MRARGLSINTLRATVIAQGSLQVAAIFRCQRRSKGNDRPKPRESMGDTVLTARASTQLIPASNNPTARPMFDGGGIRMIPRATRTSPATRLIQSSTGQPGSKALPAESGSISETSAGSARPSRPVARITGWIGAVLDSPRAANEMPTMNPPSATALAITYAWETRPSVPVTAEADAR